MTGLLERHIAAVTGGASGIGRAIALGYAREGAHVVVLDANGNGAAETAKAIMGAGGKALSFVLDVTERDKCREVAAEIGATVGRVSVLVNNAGINRRNAFTAAPEAVVKDWQDIMAVNLNGVFNVTHAFLGQLRATRGRSYGICSTPAFGKERRCACSPCRIGPSSMSGNTSCWRTFRWFRSTSRKSGRWFTETAR